MTNEQKQRVQFGIDYAAKKVQEIETGNDNLYEKWHQMDRQLLMMLDDVVEALPKAYREQAKACLAVRDRVRDARYAEIDASIAALQKEASPLCLAAVDSL
jgi:hypothetical protein